MHRTNDAYHEYTLASPSSAVRGHAYTRTRDCAIGTPPPSPIHLVDGDALMEMVARVRRDDSSGVHASSAPQKPLDAKARGQEPDGAESTHPGAPSCPRCGGNLVVRTVRKGKNAGRWFWGCETFPKCRFVRDYRASTT